MINTKPAETTWIARWMCLCFLKFLPRAKKAIRMLDAIKNTSTHGSDNHCMPLNAENVKITGSRLQWIAHIMDDEKPTRSACRYVKKCLRIEPAKLPKETGSPMYCFACASFSHRNNAPYPAWFQRSRPRRATKRRMPPRRRYDDEWHDVPIDYAGGYSEV